MNSFQALKSVVSVESEPGKQVDVGRVMDGCSRLIDGRTDTISRRTGGRADKDVALFMKLSLYLPIKL